MLRVRANVPDRTEMKCGVLVDGELVGDRSTIMRGSDISAVSYGSFQVSILHDDVSRVRFLESHAGELYCDYNERRYSTNVVIDVLYPGESEPYNRIYPYSESNVATPQ